jgi:adenine-specific DNA glycosylase
VARLTAGRSCLLRYIGQHSNQLCSWYSVDRRQLAWRNHHLWFFFSKILLSMF